MWKQGAAISRSEPESRGHTAAHTRQPPHSAQSLTSRCRDCAAMMRCSRIAARSAATVARRAATPRTAISTRCLSSAAASSASAVPRPQPIPSSYTVTHWDQISAKEKELTKDTPTPDIPTDKEWDAIIVGGSDALATSAAKRLRLGSAASLLSFDCLLCTAVTMVSCLQLIWPNKVSRFCCWSVDTSSAAPP